MAPLRFLLRRRLTLFSMRFLLTLSLQPANYLMLKALRFTSSSVALVAGPVSRLSQTLESALREMRRSSATVLQGSIEPAAKRIFQTQYRRVVG